MDYSFKEKLQAFTVFLTIIFSIILVVETNRVTPTLVYAQKTSLVGPKNDLGRNPVDIYLQKEKDDYYAQMVEELKKAKKVKRILKGELAGKEEIFLTSFSSREIGKYVMAVAGAESGGGAKPCGKFNYWGIMEFKNGGYKCRNFKDLDDAINGVKKYTGVYYRKLNEVGVSDTNLEKIFMGSYCTSACSHWIGNFTYYYQMQ